MLLTRAYHQLSFDISQAPGSSSVCYFLLPGGLTGDIRKWAVNASAAHSCNIVLISGMDWNKDMTPWPAEGVMKEKKNFPGGAGLFLSELLDDYLPTVEQWLKLREPVRYMAGISLSGLFAIWSLSRTDTFKGIGCISGSLWYDGFTEFVRKTDFPSSSRIYLSLGVKEKNTPDKRMAAVEEATKETVALLEGKGFDVTFEMVPGTHFSPAVPKFERALEIIVK